MQAMIFAAGLGTRLYPLTSDRPKAMVLLKGKPMLQHIIEKLIAYGYDEIIINIHHFGEKILEFLDANKNFGINIMISDERDLLLDTGGGIKKAAWFFNKKKPFLIHNVDIISNIDLNRMMNFHLENKGLATLALQKRESRRVLLFNQDNNLCGWANHDTKQLKLCREDNNWEERSFSGIHIVNPEMLDRIEEEGKFSIITTYMRLASQYDIKGFLHDNSFWSDVGTIEKLKEAESLSFL